MLQGLMGMRADSGGRESSLSPPLSFFSFWIWRLLETAQQDIVGEVGGGREQALLTIRFLKLI